MTDHTDVLLRIAPTEAVADEWALVLLARGLSPSLRRTPEGIALTVPAVEGDRALAELAAYEAEQPPQAPQAPPAVAPVRVVAGLLAGLALLGCFAVTVRWPTAAPWVLRGSAQAGRMRDGEWWRGVTALTLHADLPHALGNACALALFFGAAAGRLGAGVAGLLIVLAGVGGNLANAWLRDAGHTSVGASTAIFGAVGLLGGLALLQRRHVADRRRAWAAMAAALALLGLLGTGGGRVDVGAHLWGFLAGGVCGMAVARAAPAPPGPLVQWLCGGGAVGVLAYGWARALGV